MNRRDEEISTFARKKKTIAILTEDMAQRFYLTAELFKGLASFAHEHTNILIRHFSLSSINIDTDFANCDGIITDVPLDELTEPIKATGLPIVDLTGEHEDDKDIISVDCDAHKIGVMAAERFLRRGFTSFAIYGVSDTRFGRHLDDGFTATIGKSGHSCTALYRQLSPSRKEKESLLRKRLPKWVAKLPPHTAVFCHNDDLARWILNICQKIGRDVPNDIAVMGCGNDIFICQLSAVTLSSVDTNMQGIGYAAMRIMSHVIDNPVKPKKRPIFLVHPVGVFERESTSTYPIDPTWLARLLQTLDENLKRNFTVPQLAKMSGVSQATLQKAFNKAVGMSAAKYMTTIKLREAKRLIDMNKSSLKEISAMLGFSSPAYFSCAYQSFFGHSPSRDFRGIK